MVCYEQHFSQLHAVTEQRVYHNTQPGSGGPPCSHRAAAVALCDLALERALQHPQCLPLHCVQWLPARRTKLTTFGSVLAWLICKRSTPRWWLRLRLCRWWEEAAMQALF
jgi:hypothetical protein